MQIIKNQQIIEDSWQHVEDENDLPDGRIIVSYDRWKKDRAALLGRKNSGLGVEVPSDVHADDLGDDVGHFELIALNFPVFRDGRPFSTARLLRDKYGFKGELRATGDVIRDQVFYMHRCGFDSFEIRADRSIEDALEAFNEFSVTYQPAEDEPLPLWRRRR